MLLSAYRGRTAETAILTRATIQDAAARGEGLGIELARWTTAILANGLGKYDEALVAAEQASGDAPGLFISDWALPELIEAAVRSGKRQPAAAALHRLSGGYRGQRGRLGGRDRGALPCAAERGRGRRAPLSRGARAAEPDAAPTGDRSCSAALRRVAASRGPAYRRSRPATRRPRDVRRDRHGSVRRASAARAGCDRREGAHTQGRDPRRAHAPGGADRPARPRWPVQLGDRRAALPQPTHGRVAPPQGVHQARNQFPQGPARGALGR